LRRLVVVETLTEGFRRENEWAYELDIMEEEERVRGS
jgi:hypothetical protein